MNVISAEYDSSLAGEAARIATERLGELPEKLPMSALRLVQRSGDGFWLQVDAAGHVTIGAAESVNFIAGVGKLLELVLESVDVRRPLAPVEREYLPKHSLRCHYLPGHFGNAFEVCSPGEMFRYLEDLALSGANGYGDWFDVNDMPDPYHSHVYCSNSMSLWQKKKQWLHFSTRLGMGNYLAAKTNLGYLDQMRPEWVGVRGARVQGQILCPSNPDARAVGMGNLRAVFDDLSSSGVKIERVSYGPYDDGGCACEKCQPYYSVFLGQVAQAHPMLQKYYPSLVGYLGGWWLGPEEFAQVREFVGGSARDWFAGFNFSASYDVFEVPDLRPSLGEVPLGCFLHLSFSGDRRDVYYKSGGHSAPRRIQSVIRSFEPAGCHGFVSYNETFGDHFNAFVAGKLAWDPDLDIRQIAEFYGRLILGLRGPALQKTVDVLLEMESLDEASAAEWERTLSSVRGRIVTHPRQKWAYEHLVKKARLIALDHRITSEEPSRAVQELMEERIRVTEELWRDDYGLGVMRHAFVPDLMMPDWYRARQHVRPGDDWCVRNVGAMNKDA